MNLKEIQQQQLKKDIPQFKAGDTVRVSAKVVEGDNERIQLFDGVVISRRGSGVSESFTVRKVSFGVGVERIFPLHSPRIEKIEVLKIGKVRQAKINYLKELSGKAARLQAKENIVVPGTESVKETTEAAAAEVPAAAPAAEVKPEAKKAEAKKPAAKKTAVKKTEAAK